MNYAYYLCRNIILSSLLYGKCAFHVSNDINVRSMIVNMYKHYGVLFIFNSHPQTTVHQHEQTLAGHSYTHLRMLAHFSKMRWLETSSCWQNKRWTIRIWYNFKWIYTDVWYPYRCREREIQSKCRQLLPSLQLFPCAISRTRQHDLARRFIAHHNNMKCATCIYNVYRTNQSRVQDTLLYLVS